MTRRERPKKLVQGPSRACVVCGADPGDRPLPYGWIVKRVGDNAYEKGYRLDITCRDCVPF